MNPIVSGMGDGMNPIVSGMGGGGDEVVQSKFLLSMLLRSGSFHK